MSKPTDLLTSGQIAEILGVSPRRVKKLLQDGRIPGAQRAGKYVVPRYHVERFAKVERPVGNPEFGPGYVKPGLR